MARRSFEYVTQIAETDAGLNQKEVALFHYFNPRGLAADQKRIDAAITALVEAGVVKSGAILAYGGFDTYNRNRLEKMAMAKSTPSVSTMWTLKKMYAERNASAARFVTDNGGTIAPVVIRPIVEVRAEREALLQSLIKE